ncbi:hypothetical protein OE766_14475 [Pararhizobium sp. YC-54]|uniref:hypothetical protein n=1 Tax=Pararhizobium sp. YC-54 TaxID=2986920 RepID=UPI0021F7412C|nr:hypothetical protein [Pararhizobium sp. YC-54]MCV9999448.1 hypothetical protein [Pararhizobium sp. YC-54]
MSELRFRLIPVTIPPYCWHMTLELLDRRVSVSIDDQTVELPLSRLRHLPYLVLLGEPGLGKTTALEYEAGQESVEVVTCREVMNGMAVAGESTVYLDALDEYRSGENSKDKLLQLAHMIAESDLRRWRLSCRVEDWRATADLSAMRRAARNQPIAVARLLPLEEDEALVVLKGLGAGDPQAFVDEARTRGATAFLESPLSLRLLHSAVVLDGVWPRTRFGLFDRAVLALAHEYDPAREYDPRPGVDDIIGAAELMCFYLLVTGGNALWRSNALPIGKADGDFVPLQSLPVAQSLARFSLDTAIFRGEGQSFEPAHRTIAEFLAGRFLARIVLGVAGAERFPLCRAVALITSHDRKAPSELRGLYAWFAAHLSKLGDPHGAVSLIEQDAATVLAYGDAAAFATEGRKAILLNLDRDDPFFLSSRDRTTVIGGLAGDDLVSDFSSILARKVNSHLQVTVLRALEEGPPINAMQEKLHHLVLSPDRPGWLRRRAAQAWLRGGRDGQALRRLYQELTSASITYDQVSLRVDLLAAMAPEGRKPEDVRQLLLDLNQLPSDREDGVEERGALMALMIELKQSPIPVLFDARILDPSPDGRGSKTEVRHFLQQILSAAITARPDLDAKQLWSWIRNIREYEWDRLEDELVRSIGAWMDHDRDKREVEFFCALMDDSPADQGAWMIPNHFIGVVRRLPTLALVESLLALAERESQPPRRRRLFEVAAYAARTEALWPALQPRIVSALKLEKGFSAFIKSLLANPNRAWEVGEKKRKKKEEAQTDAARARNIAELGLKVEEIASGRADQFGALKWASTIIGTRSFLKRKGRWWRSSVSQTRALPQRLPKAFYSSRFTLTSR